MLTGLPMVEIRPERGCDCPAIRSLITEAFADARHGSGTEAAIVDGLRETGDLTVSLVATEDADLVGYVAVSPVTIDGIACGWFGLGPLCIRRDRRGHGIGEALVRQSLDRLKQKGAAGCVVLGDPGYYSRFGFRYVPELSYADVPPPYLQMLSFDGSVARGKVVYHAAFGAA